jgi:hypothetical protein
VFRLEDLPGRGRETATASMGMHVSRDADVILFVVRVDGATEHERQGDLRSPGRSIPGYLVENGPASAKVK